MKGEDGKCEGRNEKCEFLARESVSSSQIVRIFGKGKCKFIANFSATMVTSLPSLSVCISLSLSLSLSPKVPHAQRKRFRASYNALWVIRIVDSRDSLGLLFCNGSTCFRLQRKHVEVPGLYLRCGLANSWRCRLMVKLAKSPRHR